jgi:hypothetical protein
MVLRGELIKGAKSMGVWPPKVDTTDSNYGVAKPPGQPFPSIVIQGDSLEVRGFNP